MYKMLYFKVLSFCLRTRISCDVKCALVAKTLAISDILKVK